jgi:hypothetical protein
LHAAWADLEEVVLAKGRFFRRDWFAERLAHFQVAKWVVDSGTIQTQMTKNTYTQISLMWYYSQNQNISVKMFYSRSMNDFLLFWSLKTHIVRCVSGKREIRLNINSNYHWSR